MTTNINNDANKYETNGKFDPQKFNTGFEDYITQQNEINSKKDIEKLNKMNKTTEDKSLINYTFFELLVGIKDTWFDILDDLLSFNINMNILIQGKRIFFIGLTLFLVFTSWYLLDMLLEDEIPPIQNKNITEIHHYYHSKNEDVPKINEEDANEDIMTK